MPQDQLFDDAVALENGGSQMVDQVLVLVVEVQIQELQELMSQIFHDYLNGLEGIWVAPQEVIVGDC